MTTLTAAPGSYRPAIAGSTDRAIRLSTAAAVLAVAGIAAYVSYWHAYAVVRAYGETGITAQLEPATIDGLVYASSMVILHAARHRLPVPALARWLLGLGIMATLTANMAQGWSHGPIGAVVAAWPAASLAGSYELLVWLIATTSGTPQPEPPADPRCETTACWAAARPAPAAATGSGQRGDRDPEAETADDAAVAAYRLSVQAGNPLSERKLAQMFGRTSRRWARARITQARQSPGNRQPPPTIRDRHTNASKPRRELPETHARRSRTVTNAKARKEPSQEVAESARLSAWLTMSAAR